MGLCPPVDEKSKKCNFYLRSLARTTPACWYSTRVLGVNAIKSTVGKLLKDAQLDGFFSNHSLRRSSTTRLFQAGVDRKILKEFTGHVSDAVDKYQITSEVQRQRLSEVISGEKVNKTKVVSVDEKEEKDHNNSVEVVVTSEESVGQMACSCMKKNVKTEDAKSVGQLLNDILVGRKYGKAKIKLEIDFTE